MGPRRKGISSLPGLKRRGGSKVFVLLNISGLTVSQAGNMGISRYANSSTVSGVKRIVTVFVTTKEKYLGGSSREIQTSGQKAR